MDGSRRRDGSGNWHAIQEMDDTIQVELFAGINSDLIQSPWTEALYLRTTKMPNRTKSALAALLFFGSASAVLADTNNRTDQYGSVGRRAVSVTMSHGRNGAVNHDVRPFTAEEKAWFAAPQPALVQSAPFCVRGITGTRMAWIKLTEPGGKLIHINVEQVTSVRSDTQIPGAKAQIDLTSGKFQGVQENVDQVMQLITATAGPLANDECA
jgi:hypothetical protein